MAIHEGFWLWSSRAEAERMKAERATRVAEIMMSPLGKIRGVEEGKG
jgi:hypothetical protein